MKTILFVTLLLVASAASAQTVYSGAGTMTESTQISAGSSHHCSKNARGSLPADATKDTSWCAQQDDSSSNGSASSSNVGVVSSVVRRLPQYGIHLTVFTAKGDFKTIAAPNDQDVPYDECATDAYVINYGVKEGKKMYVGKDLILEATCVISKMP